jgi:hypothetical protein
MKINQPYRLKFGDYKFVRVSKYVDRGNGVSEGPYYQHAGDATNGDVWLPDLAFVLGQTSTPTAMHYIRR